MQLKKKLPVVHLRSKNPITICYPGCGGHDTWVHCGFTPTTKPYRHLDHIESKKPPALPPSSNYSNFNAGNIFQLASPLQGFGVEHKKSAKKTECLLLLNKDTL